MSKLNQFNIKVSRDEKGTLLMKGLADILENITKHPFTEDEIEGQHLQLTKQIIKNEYIGNSSFTSLEHVIDESHDIEAFQALTAHFSYADNKLEDAPMDTPALSLRNFIIATKDNSYSIYLGIIEKKNKQGGYSYFHDAKKTAMRMYLLFEPFGATISYHSRPSDQNFYQKQTFTTI